MDQQRVLKIKFESGKDISFQSLDYFLKLSTQIILWFQKFEPKDSFILQYILSHKNLKDKLSYYCQYIKLGPHFDADSFKNSLKLCQHKPIIGVAFDLNNTKDKDWAQKIDTAVSSLTSIELVIKCGAKTNLEKLDKISNAK